MIDEEIYRNISQKWRNNDGDGNMIAKCVCVTHPASNIIIVLPNACRVRKQKKNMHDATSPENEGDK